MLCFVLERFSELQIAQQKQEILIGFYDGVEHYICFYILIYLFGDVHGWYILEWEVTL